MARRRRLNKKVALVGTTVLLLLALAAVCVILRLNRNPAPLIADGDAAWAAHDCQTARESYTRAYGLIRSSEGKIDLLFKLAEVYRELDQWDRVLGCWGQVLTSDPQNVKARLGQLKYAYLLADGLGSAGRSMSGYWEEVLSQARKATDLIEKSGLSSDEKTKWEPSFGTVDDRAWHGGARQLGPHLHFVKGRAAFELAALGAVMSPGELLQEAQNDLDEAKKLDPNNVQVYRYLAEVFVKKGETAASRGNTEQKNAAEQQADDILAEAVRAAGQVPEAHVNVLMRKLTVAQRGSITATREQMKALEPQYADSDAEVSLQSRGLGRPGTILFLLRGLSGFRRFAGDAESSYPGHGAGSYSGRWQRRVPDADGQLPLPQVLRLRRRAGLEQGDRIDGTSLWSCRAPRTSPGPCSSPIAFIGSPCARCSASAVWSGFSRCPSRTRPGRGFWPGFRRRCMRSARFGAAARIWKS